MSNSPNGSRDPLSRIEAQSTAGQRVSNPVHIRPPPSTISACVWVAPGSSSWPPDRHDNENGQPVNHRISKTEGTRQNSQNVPSTSYNVVRCAGTKPDSRMISITSLVEVRLW